MKGTSNWSYAPYNPLIKKETITICRVVPTKDTILLQWIDNKKSKSDYKILFKLIKQSEEEFKVLNCSKKEITIEGLIEEEEYEIKIVRSVDGLTSESRFARCGTSIGTVVNYLHPSDKIYEFSGRFLCSPSLIKMSSGKLIASMDVYDHRTPQNLTLLFESKDDGKSWTYITDLFPCFWGKLFLHKEQLYMLAHTTEYGSLVISKSIDEGKNWSAPVVLFRSSGLWSEGGLHKGPMPITKIGNKFLTAIDYGTWDKDGFYNGIASVDVNSDLLNAENWSLSKFKKFDEEIFEKYKINGTALEGNVVEGKNGEIFNILRLQIHSQEDQGITHDRALALRTDSDLEDSLLFHDVLHFEGGSNSKFDILYDEKSRCYLSIANQIVDASEPTARNVLSLAISKDLTEFKVAKIVIDLRSESSQKVGIQYVSFIIDENDLLFLSRTATNRADSFHNSNYITFHRVKNFRQYIHLDN